MKGINSERYFGIITDVIGSDDSYKVRFRIPGVGEEFLAYPSDRSSDEPNVGDLVFIEDLDPLFHSYFIFSRISEDAKGEVIGENGKKDPGKGTFQGTRSRGNMIEYNDDYIQLGNYKNGDYNSNTDSPECTNYIRITKEGDIEVNASRNSKIKITGGSLIQIDGSSVISIMGDSTLEIGGNLETYVHGNHTLRVEGEYNIEASEINISGTPSNIGTLKVNPLPCFRGVFNDAGDTGVGDLHPVTSEVGMMMSTSGVEISAEQKAKEENLSLS